MRDRASRGYAHAMGSDQRFDAIVIGGGPAGAVTARGLARLGWHTALIERGPRYRSKACGHCLNSRATSLLQQAGLLNATSAIARGTVAHLRVHAANGESLKTPLQCDQLITGGKVGNLIVPRSDFDQMLVDAAGHAGAVIMQNTAATVRVVDESDVHVHVRSNGALHTLRTPLVVGADGTGSAVARAASLAANARIGRCYGFSFDLACGDLEEHTNGAIAMHVARRGYLGLVSHGRGRLHCAALVSARAGSDSRDPLQFLQSMCRDHPSLRHASIGRIERNDMEDFVGTGPMPWRPRRIANDRVALVGDAAGYIEPFTGEGMAWAIEAALLLIDTLANAKPRQWNYLTAMNYQQRWRRAISRRQLACRAVAFALARPWMVQGLLRAARRHPFFPQRAAQWMCL